MVVKGTIHISDLDHEGYLRHQWSEISPRQIEAHARNIKPAHHFEFARGTWQPKAYEGFAVVSMVDNDAANFALAPQLEGIQLELSKHLDEDAFYWLPPPSFHQTIANTLSDIRFKQFIQGPGLEHEFPAIVNDAFNNISLADLQTTIRMKLIGLSIFHTAIGILGVIESEEEYRQITSFRSQFYDDTSLGQLDIRMTRPFIGHVTLGYFEKELSVRNQETLATVINEINVDLSRTTRYFLLTKTELRRYQHLAEFKKESHYPTFHFNQ